MKKSLYTFLLFATTIAYGQNSQIKRTNHWYFGSGAGIDFSSGIAVADTSGTLHTYEGCATISDTLGNLLFYTDGDTVWNKNHQPMPNGTGLLGCGNYGSSAQAALIIPHPGNDSLFYIFTNDCWENIGAAGFRYSVVNMKLNGGFGDVIIKNILLFAPSVEGLAAVKHANGRDIWVMTHEFNSNNFFAYKISNTGINNEPIISAVGSIYTDFWVYLRFSPNGKKLASAFYYGNELLQFNDSTGTLYNPIPIIGYGGEYSPVFSPDNSKLYLMNDGYLIFQYCLSNMDSVSINNSMAIVADHLDNSAYGSLSNAPDGKIYVSSIYGFNSISTINNPNNYGANCNFINHNFYLGGKQSELGLPNFIESYFYDSTLVPQSCDSINGIIENIKDNSFKIYPNPAKNILNIESSIQIEQIEIIDIYGNIKLRSNHSPIELLGLHSGIYFVKINTESKLTISKILIE
jgi:hypothetical protein